MFWSTQKCKISDLIPAKYNPRKLSQKQEQDLSNSLTKFSLADPIVINFNNVIIGGHQRIKVLKKQNADEVDCRVPDRLLTEKEEKELNLRLNKNLGEWDDEMLKDFDRELLEDVGFFEDELDKIFSVEVDEKEAPRKMFEDERDSLPIKDLLMSYEKIMVQFSGGKDSIAMVLYLIYDLGIPKEKMELIWAKVPFLEWDDAEEYIDFLASELNIKLKKCYNENDEKDFLVKLKKRGYPGRMLNWCNSDFKVNPVKKYYKNFDNFIVVMGLRAEESPRRAKMLSRGVWLNQNFCFPIFDFTMEQIIDLINKYKIKMHYSYKVFDRFSCLACYQQTKKDFAALRIFFPKQFFKVLYLFSVALESNSFCDGTSSYKIDLFKNIVAYNVVGEKKGIDFHFWYEDFTGNRAEKLNNGS